MYYIICFLESTITIHLKKNNIPTIHDSRDNFNQIKSWWKVAEDLYMLCLPKIKKIMTAALQTMGEPHMCMQASMIFTFRLGENPMWNIKGT